MSRVVQIQQKEVWRLPPLHRRCAALRAPQVQIRSGVATSQYLNVYSYSSRVCVQMFVGPASTPLSLHTSQLPHNNAHDSGYGAQTLQRNRNRAVVVRWQSNRLVAVTTDSRFFILISARYCYYYYSPRNYRILIDILVCDSSVFLVHYGRIKRTTERTNRTEECVCYIRLYIYPHTAIRGDFGYASYTHTRLQRGQFLIVSIYNYNLS